MDGEEVVVPPVCWMDASLDLGPWVGEVCGAPYDWVVSIEVGTIWVRLAEPEGFRDS